MIKVRMIKIVLLFLIFALISNMAGIASAAGYFGGNDSKINYISRKTSLRTISHLTIHHTRRLSSVFLLLRRII